MHTRVPTFKCMKTKFRGVLWDNCLSVCLKRGVGEAWYEEAQRGCSWASRRKLGET